MPLTYMYMYMHNIRVNLGLSTQIRWKYETSSAQERYKTIRYNHPSYLTKTYKQQTQDLGICTCPLLPSCCPMYRSVRPILSYLLSSSPSSQPMSMNGTTRETLAQQSLLLREVSIKISQTLSPHLCSVFFYLILDNQLQAEPTFAPL